MIGQAIWINSNNNNNSNNNSILFSVLSVTGWDFITHRLRGLHGGGYLKSYCFENVFVAAKSDPAPASASMHHQLQIAQNIFIRKHSNNDVQTCFRGAPRLDSRARVVHPSLRGTTRCLPIMKFRL